MGTFRVSSANGIVARIQTAQPKVFRVTGSPRGPIGPNGKSVEIRNSGTAIQWRYIGDVDWIDIVTLSSLVGPAGPAIEMQVSGGYIQWRVIGAVSWTNLIALTALIGPPGLDGTNGTDGKTIRSGTGAPSGGTGVDGDFYINLTNYNIYGPKTSGSWGSPTSLVGPAGAGSGDMLRANNLSDLTNATTARTNLGLGNVDNTSDASKPVSTATQTALNNKVDKVATTSRIYATDGAGAQTTLDYGTTFNAAGQIVQRATSGFISVPTPTASGHATSKNYVDAADALKATDTAVVHNTGAETVAGIKTFSSSPIVPTPTTGSQAATKAYVDGGFGSNSFVMAPVAVTGTKDGTNPNFTAPEAYVAGTLGVYLNGDTQYSGVDFTETTPGSGTFAFVGYNPISTDQIRVTYQKSLTATAGNADTIDGFHANATPTANQLLPLNSSAKFSPAVIDAPYGEATLASTFVLTTASAMGTYFDTGLSITLPAAGTYEISGEFRGDFSPSSSSSPTWISWKYYDATAGSFVPRAKRIGPIGFSTTSSPVTGTTPMTVQYTVTVPTVIKVYLAKQNVNTSGAGVSMIGSSADDYGQNVIRYKRIA